MKRTNTATMSQLIDEFIEDEGLKEGLMAVQVYRAWDSVVGQGYIGYTTSKCFKNGVLHCTISSSMVRNQLFFMQRELVDQINGRLGKNLVTRLVLR